MRPLARLTLATSIAFVLAGCAENTLPSGPLTQQDTEASLESISDQLQSGLERAANDEGVLALSQLPFGPDDAANPLGEIGSAAQLPRGIYHFDTGSSSWVRGAPSDDLVLTWPYSDDPYEIPTDPEPVPTPAPESLTLAATSEATLTFDWNANSPTREVLTLEAQSVEVPTGPHLSLQAAAGIAAELDAELVYYESAACPAGILEPTSLTLNSQGTFLTLENVGFSTTGEGLAATLKTQGKVTLTQNDIYLGWDITARGGPGRGLDCFTQGISVGPGTFAAEVGGFTGNTRSVALRFGFSDPDEGDAPVLSDGAVVINGDESRAVTFEGSTVDANGNGVPGDTLTVTYPDGTSSTLEDLLSGLGSSFRMMLRP